MIRKLGRRKSQREALIKNQMRSLFTHGSLTTTTPKAKVLKQKSESFLSKIKKDSLETQRMMHTVLGNADLVKKALEFSKKEEGKVSIVRVSFRDGDSAETSKITIVNYADPKAKKASPAKKKKTKKKDQKKGETQFVQEKKDDKTLEKGQIDVNINKERAKSRSGI